MYKDYIIHDDNNIKGFFGEYRWLSNFHESNVYFENLIYTSTENAYQAAKCVDAKKRLEFLGITPSQSKKLGRSVEVRSDWQDVKYDIMALVVFDKFYRNLELRTLLVNTGSKYIEETNHWKDMYWGVYNGVGENNLGKILMKVRQFWQTQEKSIF